MGAVRVYGRAGLIREELALAIIESSQENAGGERRGSRVSGVNLLEGRLMGAARRL